MKITHYKICHAGTAEELDEIINRNIKEGWQPIGGITMLMQPSRTAFAAVGMAQAVVKYEVPTFN